MKTFAYSLVMKTFDRMKIRFCWTVVAAFLSIGSAHAVGWTTVQGWNGTWTGAESWTVGGKTVFMTDNLLLDSATEITIENNNTQTTFVNTDALRNECMANNGGYRTEDNMYNLTAGTVATISFDRPMNLYGLQLYSYYNRTTLGVSALEISYDGVTFTSLGVEPVSVAATANATANFAAYGGYLLEGETVVVDERETPWAVGVRALRITFANAGSYVEWVVQGVRTPVSYHSVTFYNFDGSAVVWGSNEVEPGTAVTIPEAPARDGYYFAYWSLEPDGAEPIDETIFAAVDNSWTVYAVYFDNGFTYAVDFLNRDGTIYKTFNVKPGESVADADLPVLPDEEWYKFSGWAGTDYQEVTGTCQIQPVFIPYHRVTVKDYYGTVLAELKVLDGEAVTLPEDLAVAPVLPNGSVFAGWSADLSKITADTVLTPVYHPANSVVWSHVVWKANEYYDNEKVFLPEYSEGNLLLTPDAGVTLRCYRLTDPDTELAAGYTIFTNNLLHTTGTYNCEIPNQTMLEIVLPHDAEHLQRQVQSIVIWTTSNKPATGYAENEITIDAVEYRRKADSAWKPVSEIESLNGYATKAVEGASAAYGFRIVMERRDGSPLIPMAAAVRLRLGTTGTGTATRIGEIQVFGGAVAQSGVCVLVR